MNHFLNLMLNSYSDSNISQIAQNNHLSSKTLNRLFLSRVGVTAKTFQRIIRFQRALQSVGDVPPESVVWTSVATRHGFYDQSHFVREVKELYGISPGELLNSLSNFYNTSLLMECRLLSVQDFQRLRRNRDGIF